MLKKLNIRLSFTQRSVNSFSLIINESKRKCIICKKQPSKKKSLVVRDRPQPYPCILENFGAAPSPMPVLNFVAQSLPRHRENNAITGLREQCGIWSLPQVLRSLGLSVLLAPTGVYMNVSVCVSISILNSCFPPRGNYHIDVRTLPSTSFMSEKRGELCWKESSMEKNNIQCVLKALKEEE